MKKEQTPKGRTLDQSHPLLASEWDPRNSPLVPGDVTAGSNRRVWWRGACGHSWQASIKNRAKGAGCPYCSGNRVLRGFNDLLAVDPALAAEWSDKNAPMQPVEVTACSPRLVWWKCILYGHEWTARIADRHYGSGCPYCAGHRISRGLNDLAALYPSLAAEWSERNLPKMPESVFPKSRENAWWKCRACGHEWTAVVGTRVKGSGCSVCAGQKAKAGINDILTTDPGLAEEWDYGRNGSATLDGITRDSCRTFWWKGRCGHRWRARIVDRAYDGAGCPICARDFKMAFPDLYVRHCIKKAGYTAVADEDSILGIPLANYIQEKRAVIEFSKGEWNTKSGRQWEKAKTALCRRAGIKLVRILKRGEAEFEGCANVTRLDGSDEAFAEAVRLSLGVLGIHVETEIEKEREALFIEFKTAREEAVRLLPEP